MKPGRYVIDTPVRVAHLRRIRPPEYWADVECLIVERRADGSIVTDTGHPRYKELAEKWKRPTVPRKLMRLRFHALWYALHHAHEWPGGLTPALIDDVRFLLPEGGCGCRSHAGEMFEQNPPPYDGTPWEQYVWSVKRHDEVNVRTGKPEIGPLILQSRRPALTPARVAK